MNNRQVEFFILIINTCDRRAFSSAGVARFAPLFAFDIIGHRLPRLFVSFVPSDRIGSPFASTARRVVTDGDSLGRITDLKNFKEKFNSSSNKNQLKKKKKKNSEHSK